MTHKFAAAERSAKPVAAGGRDNVVQAMTAFASTGFPFSAIVGQDDMKTALTIAAVDPTVGGVLVLGDRGTGKSTAVRALAGLLPPLEVVADCPYNCEPGAAAACPACGSRPPEVQRETKLAPVPLVDLPLGATEDRVVGALDLERVLVDGVKVFQPGLLARANRGFLYVDEIYLLEDHLVDLLIDVAASGINIVERDGLSIRHPARFVLVGSGNPEEGELRPQLLDRFGLCVEITTPQDVATRVEIVKRRDAYDRDPIAFRDRFAGDEARQRSRIVAAQRSLAAVRVPDTILEHAARLCMALGADGLRGELTLVRAARALAALDGGSQVEISHLREVATSVLRHRLRRSPLDESGSAARIDRAAEELLAQ
jgi:magnesium chelatase subunit I